MFCCAVVAYWLYSCSVLDVCYVLLLVCVIQPFLAVFIVCLFVVLSVF